MPTPAIPTPTGPPRLNVIFHGLMAFRDAGPQSYDVLIPHPGDSAHKAKYGNPRNMPLLEFPLERSFFQLTGVRDGATTPAAPNPKNVVILHNGKLQLQHHMVRTVVRAPKPDAIRHYRCAEIPTTSVATNAETFGAIPVPPSFLHETTVFSYFFFHQPRLIGGDQPFDIPDVGSKYFNLCIYSQPDGPCLADDNALFNNMFKFHSSGANLALNLFAANAFADRPPQATAIGIDEIELRALSEFENGFNAACTDPSGCGGGFLNDCGNS